jgi:hypothetical protein
MPGNARGELPYLKLLEQRARIARAGISRLIADPHSGPLDYMSEGDRILHQLADPPPDTYRLTRT